MLVDSAVDVPPTAGDLDVGLVDEPAVTDRVATRPCSIREKRREPLHPAEQSDVIDVDPTLAQELLDISVRQTESQIPAHPQHDHFRREPKAPERRTRNHSGGSTPTRSHPTPSSPTWAPRQCNRAFTRLAHLVEGAHGVVYDTALRGVHHQILLRDLGLLSINRVAAAVANPKTARRSERRVEKSAYIEDKTITIADREITLALYARGGAVGIGELTETGDLTFTELPRIRTHRNRDKNGKYRWYNDYQLPDRYDTQTITVRLHGNTADERRKFNRTENVRPIPPTDPDFARLYPRRNDSESINRNLEDTLWLGRAHSIGHARQHLTSLSGWRNRGSARP